MRFTDLLRAAWECSCYSHQEIWLREITLGEYILNSLVECSVNITRFVFKGVEMQLYKPVFVQLQTGVENEYA